MIGLSSRSSIPSTARRRHAHARVTRRARLGGAGLPTAQDWEEVLGVPLPDYLAVVFALYVGSNMRRGRFTTADLAHRADVGAFLDRDAATVEKLTATHLAADLSALYEQARTEDAAETETGRQAWLTNPLLAAAQPVEQLVVIAAQVLWPRQTTFVVASIWWVVASTVMPSL
ncbi:hypothetical protein AB0H42_35480 [Nocardia sp. NPDC050799]|uniref:hypothetical protein n=1 Tax=Nocardia sp. NPDC050799 TaxID=3154842 RepID=UPI0034029C02